MKQELVRGSLIKKAHDLIAAHVQPGDTVVDATLGNGHDTLFLARCVGEHGKVIGFDVQESALRSTRKNLSEHGIRDTCLDLHLMSHHRMGEVINSGVSAVIFNLGYLPGGDKKRITTTETTLQALDAARACLTPGGLLTVMCYPGHPGGDHEAGAVRKWFETTQNAILYHRENARETTPFLCLIQ